MNRPHDFGVAMARRTDRDAGVAVEKNIAVGVFDPDARAAFSDELPIGARIRRRHKLMVSSDNREQGDPDLLKFCGAGALRSVYRLAVRLMPLFDRHDQGHAAA